MDGITQENALHLLFAKNLILWLYANWNWRAKYFWKRPPGNESQKSRRGGLSFLPLGQGLRFQSCFSSHAIWREGRNFEIPPFAAMAWHCIPRSSFEGRACTNCEKRDGIKIIPPIQLVAWTVHILAIVPPWTHLYRIQRDIPVSASVEHGNLRKLALHKLREEWNGTCLDICIIEVGMKHIHAAARPDQVKLICRDYVANEGWETFNFWRCACGYVGWFCCAYRKIDVAWLPELTTVTVSCENCTCTGPPWRYWLAIQPAFNIKGKASCSWKKWNASPVENTDHTNIGHRWCRDKTLFARAAEVFVTIGLNVDWLLLLVLRSLLQMLPTPLLLSATICWLFFFYHFLVLLFPSLSLLRLRFCMPLVGTTASDCMCKHFCQKDG